jgi:L-amino acid N-acyltransferase YncA
MYHGSGWMGVVKKIIKKLISPFYQKEVQYVWLRGPKGASNAPSPWSAIEGDRTECIVLESLKSFDYLRSQIPPSLATKLEMRLKEGCILFMAQRLTKDGSRKQIVGYNIAQQGVFSALGHVERVSSSILFSHYIEVLPEFRGQRVLKVICDAKDLYCQRNGFREHCGVVSTDNLPSIRGLIRLGARIVGTVQLVSILGGRYKREPRWDKVLEMIADETSGSEHPMLTRER